MGENGRRRRVEDTLVDPEPAQVVRRRQARLTGPDHTTASYTCRVVQQRTGTWYDAPGPAGSAAVSG